jgi:hypothetical protein
VAGREQHTVNVTKLSIIRRMRLVVPGIGKPAFRKGLLDLLFLKLFSGITKQGGPGGRVADAQSLRNCGNLPQATGATVGNRRTELEQKLLSTIGPGGFEPPLTDPKSAVLPLDEGPETMKPSRQREAAKGSEQGHG